MSFDRVYDGNGAGIGLKGQWTLILESGGIIKQVVNGPNVVCTNGKEFLASFLSSAAAGAATFTCKYVAVGTDTTAESAAQTTLGVEIARQTGTASYISGQIYQVTATFASGTGTGAITEYGCFSSSSVGTMLNRSVQSVINKGANDSLTAVLQVTFS